VYLTWPITDRSIIMFVGLLLLINCSIMVSLLYEDKLLCKFICQHLCFGMEQAKVAKPCCKGCNVQ